jgi:LTXXQ motif family protein
LAGHRFSGAVGLGGRSAFAHNGFSGSGFGRFNGVRGFDAHGFNRNAFGSMAGWNAWGNNYWGAGWNDWGSGWGYWAGPVFWPFFFGDALTFAIWPYAFYDPFFAYGPDLLLTSIFWPGPLFSPYYAYNPYYYWESPYYYGENSLFNIYGNPPYANGYASYGSHGGRHHRLYAARSVAHARLEADSNSALTCGGLAPGVVSLPIDQIQRAIRPADAQVAMLDDLKAASAQADNLLRASCPTEVPLTPIARLDAVMKRIQAMSQAVQILRPPLTTLYNSLDDEQKVRFAAIGAQTKKYRRARIAREESPSGNLGGLCKQQTENFTQLPVQRIKEVIKPTEEQNAAFDALKSASAKAAAHIDASCPADVPQTLTGRLDAVGKRLDALAEAVDPVKPALAEFYNSLADEQKARFNVIGRDSPAGTPQVETKPGG